MIIALNECLAFSRHELQHSFFTKRIILMQQPIRICSEFHVSMTDSIIVRNGRPIDMSLLNFKKRTANGEQLHSA